MAEYTTRKYSSLEAKCIILIYHVYKKDWDQIIGQGFLACTEEFNKHDRHTVAVVGNDKKTVGHTPIEMSKISYYFIFNKWQCHRR